VRNQAVKNYEPFRARRASEACANPGEAGVMPRSGMTGACRNGNVKNQRGLDSEALQISSGGNFALLNLCQCREKLSGENFASSARLAIRLRRIYGGFAAVWRALPAAKRACRNGNVENQRGADSEALQISSG
jgi:hypothetical protein